MKIDYIRYGHGMIKKLSERDDIKFFELNGEAVPENIRQLIESNDLLSLSGPFGMKEGATPQEYEELEIRSENQTTKIQIFNKGMSMFMQETPELKRLFEVCCRLQRMVSPVLGVQFKNLGG